MMWWERNQIPNPAAPVTHDTADASIFITACYHLDTNVRNHALEEQAQILSPYQCQVSCQLNPKCLYFTYNWDTQKCFLKDGIDGTYRVNPCCVSGPAFCDGKVKILHTYTNVEQLILTEYFIQFKINFENRPWWPSDLTYNIKALFLMLFLLRRSFFLDTF